MVRCTQFLICYQQGKLKVDLRRIRFNMDERWLKRQPPLVSLARKPVFPDWPILKGLWLQSFFQRQAKYLSTSWAVLKNFIFMQKLLSLLFGGNFWEKLDYFLFQHLVTLTQTKLFCAPFSLYRSTQMPVTMPAPNQCD